VEVLELPECPPSSAWTCSSASDHTSPGDDRPNNVRPSSLSSSSYDNNHVHQLQDTPPAPPPGLRRTSPASDDLTSIMDVDDYVSPRSSPTRTRTSVLVSDGYDGAETQTVGASAASVMSRSLGALSTVDVLSSRQLSRFGNENEALSEGRTVMRVGLLVVLLSIFVLLLAANPPHLPFDIGTLSLHSLCLCIYSLQSINSARPQAGPWCLTPTASSVLCLLPLQGLI